MTRNRFASVRALFTGVGLLGLTIAATAPAQAAVGPDVVVFSLSGIGNYGVQNGYAGYSVGTTSCNRGDTPLNWCDQGSGCAAGAGPEDHPVIAQNMYRLKSGRFEQIGMSWLKHGFVSTNTTTGGCSGVTGTSCVSPPAGGNQLGVGCTDPYGSSLNGSRPLGPRSEVNATTGVYPFPFTPFSASQTWEQRVKVATTDVDAAVNPGALYWAEAQYIASDDADANNSLNNASYRAMTFGGAPGFNGTATGATFERQPAIYAWKMNDPTVTLLEVDVPGAIRERYQVARKVTDLGGGIWHYELAVRNHNSDRSAQSFGVTFAGGATSFTNAGFKDIEAHSGEPYPGTDWTLTTASNQISWATETFATNNNANALRWSTMFNFWFDADRPPSDDDVYTIVLFKPGSPTQVTFRFDQLLFDDGVESGNYVAWTGARTN